jgi:UDP-N-acetylmuramyl pentapeptide synthase
MKNLVQKFLAFLARAIIEKYQPKIIGITGSVGKTSTKEAIFL